MILPRLSRPRKRLWYPGCEGGLCPKCGRWRKGSRRMAGMAGMIPGVADCECCVPPTCGTDCSGCCTPLDITGSGFVNCFACLNATFQVARVAASCRWTVTGVNLADSGCGFIEDVDIRCRTSITGFSFCPSIGDGSPPLNQWVFEFLVSNFLGTCDDVCSMASLWFKKTGNINSACPEGPEGTYVFSAMENDTSSPCNECAAWTLSDYSAGQFTVECA